MRYPPEHKSGVHQEIVKDASRRVRAEGLNGVAVATVMSDTGLTHGGFYKHFASKDELLLASFREAFRDFIARLVSVAEQARPGEAWMAIVQAYLSSEYCDHVEYGCPLTALAPEFARADKRMKGGSFPSSSRTGIECFRLCREGRRPTKSEPSFRSFQP